MIIEKIIDEFKLLNEVDAIALGGSRTNLIHDSKSDYDVYIYISRDIDDLTRRNILSKYCKVMEISNHFWEKEDNCVMNDGIDLDIIYRKIDDFDKDIERVAIKNIPSNGYTTCLWYNLIHSKILYDRNGKLNSLVKKYNIPYSEELKNNIISNNMSLLSNALPSYDKQIQKAFIRQDIVSINHRVTEFLASYFDIIFALNKKMHPGEKRLVSQALQNCEILPRNFEKNIEGLLKNLYSDKLMEYVNLLIEELKNIL